MGARAAQDSNLLCLWGAVAGAVLSTVATVIQMIVVLEATNQATLSALWLPLVCAGVTAAAYGVLFTIIALRQKAPDAVNLGQPFSLKTALLFAETVIAVMLLAAALQQWLSKEGVIVASAIAGFADTHSAAVAVASLVAAGKLSVNKAVLPILTSLTTNTITKIVLAVLSGSWRFISAIIPVQCLLCAKSDCPLSPWGCCHSEMWSECLLWVVNDHSLKIYKIPSKRHQNHQCS
jgi:uncharacterized membrane protein (DUF4010 family)